MKSETIKKAETLKSLNKKYNLHGYTIEKNVGSSGTKIYFDGGLVAEVYDRCYIVSTCHALDAMIWLQGQTCDLPSQAPTTTIDNTKQAMRKASNEDGSIDLIGYYGEEIDFSERKQMVKLINKITPKVDTDLKVCLNGQVVQKTEVKQAMQPISHFQEVLEINTRVSLDELNEYEQTLQDELFPVETVEDKMAEIEALWEKVAPSEEIKAPNPATPMEVMAEVTTAKEQLNALATAGVYYDQIHGVSRVKFIVYKSDSNLGTITYNASLKTWEAKAAEDRYLHGYGSAKGALGHLIIH